MGVDFNRISFGISSGTSRTGFGSIVSFPSGGGGGCPAADIFVSYTENAEYPIALGGTYFSFSPLGDVPNQQGDLSLFTNGNCGTYQEWTGIDYKPYSNLFYTDTIGVPNYIQIEVPSASGNFYDAGYQSPEYRHDGMGGYYQTYAATIWVASGGLIAEVANQSDINGAGYMLDNGTTTQYRHDGSGSYYTTSGGGCYTSGGMASEIIRYAEVPSGSGQTYFDGTAVQYFWNGSCGTTSSAIGSYYAYGTSIYYDGLFTYYWDGNGGYYY